MDTQLEKAPRSSRKARLSAARLAAVQAVYQMTANEQAAVDVIPEFKLRRLGQPVEGAPMVLPDHELFESIVSGVETARADLEDRLFRDKAPPAEALLRALLLCGAYELLMHRETDAPIIISDYLHVAHAFFDQGEARLVNGILDRVNRDIRGHEES